MKEDKKLSCANTNYDRCMYTALEDRMMAEHGCVAPFIRSDKDICTSPNASRGAYKIAWNRVTNQVPNSRPSGS